MALVAVAAAAYLWATGLMDSLYAYRSPFAAAPLSAGLPVGSPLAGRVVVVLVDGLRVDTAADPAVMPELDRLRRSGASATLHSTTPSYSIPSWTVLMTGAWPELSDGPAMNPLAGQTSRTWTQDNLMAAAHRAGLTTAYAGTDWFPQLLQPGTVDHLAPLHEETDAADEASTVALLGFLAADQGDLLLLHLNEVDHAGHHAGGPRDQRWDAAATKADARIGRVAAALDPRRDTIVVVSDHGHVDAGGHGGQDAIVLQEPLVVSGAGIRPGSYGDHDQVDVAPTVATLLGTSLPAVNQGHPLVDLLAGVADLTAAETAQQAQLLQRYAASLGAATPEVAAQSDPISAYQKALADLRSSALTKERLLRGGVAVAAVALLALLLARSRRPRRWFAVGALVYAVTFHLQYAVLRGRTYSLSSVLSSGDVIAATSVCAAVAFLVASAVTLAGGGPRLREDLGSTHLWLAAWVLAGLAIPALWTAVVNGPTVTWTLPEMTSMFLGFSAVLQALVVAALALVLLPAAALASRALGRRRATA